MPNPITSDEFCPVCTGLNRGRDVEEKYCHWCRWWTFDAELGPNNPGPKGQPPQHMTMADMSRTNR